MGKKVKLLVEIDEKEYENVKNGHLPIRVFNACVYAVENGTPLPKGHGDLIDRDELSPKIHGAKSIVAVLEAPAIVEADKENDNES